MTCELSTLVRSFDLKFRPTTYDARADPAAALLAEAAGQRAPLCCPEVTIARIVFGRLAPNVIQIRARRRLGHFVFRILDDLGTEFRINDRMSSWPLNLGQMIRLIENSKGIGEELGLVFPVLDTVLGFGDDRRDSVRSGGGGYVSAGDRSALVDAVRAFVRVESDFYPELERYIEYEVDAWLERVGCLSCAHATEGLDLRKQEPAPSPAAAGSCVVGPHAEAIDRIVRAWWRSQQSPRTTDEALEIGRKVNVLYNALRKHTSQFGRLPAGRFQVEAGPPGRRIDIDDLTETGELIERVLREGTVREVEEPDWLAQCREHLTVYEFGNWLYVAHAGGFDGPFDEDSLAEWFYEGVLMDLGSLEVRVEWDSGGPGAGAGVVSVYGMFGLLFVMDDMGLSGPYDDFEEAIRRHAVYTVNCATTCIWDAEHGLVFERGVLYRPDVVERYGEVHGEVTVAAEASPESAAGTAGGTK